VCVHACICLQVPEGQMVPSSDPAPVAALLAMLGGALSECHLVPCVLWRALVCCCVLHPAALSPTTALLPPPPCALWRSRWAADVPWRALRPHPAVLHGPACLGSTLGAAGPPGVRGGAGGVHAAAAAGAAVCGQRHGRAAHPARRRADVRAGPRDAARGSAAAGSGAAAVAGASAMARAACLACPCRSGA
jgi:hypothetical protein